MSVTRAKERPSGSLMLPSTCCGRRAAGGGQEAAAGAGKERVNQVPGPWYSAAVQYEADPAFWATDSPG